MRAGILLLVWWWWWKWWFGPGSPGSGTDLSPAVPKLLPEGSSALKQVYSALLQVNIPVPVLKHICAGFMDPDLTNLYCLVGPGSCKDRT